MIGKSTKEGCMGDMLLRPNDSTEDAITLSNAVNLATAAASVLKEADKLVQALVARNDRMDRSLYRTQMRLAEMTQKYIDAEERIDELARQLQARAKAARTDRENGCAG